MGEGEDGNKPKRSSLPKDKKLEDVDMAEALLLLALPRAVGIDAETGEEVVAGLGRFGPFVRRGKTFASLATHDEMFTVSIRRGGEASEREKGPPDSAPRDGRAP